MKPGRRTFRRWSIAALAGLGLAAAMAARTVMKPTDALPSLYVDHAFGLLLAAVGLILVALGIVAWVLNRERQRYLAAARALSESEKRFRIASELSADYAYAVAIGADGRHEDRWVTESFTRITGYSLAEIKSRGGGLALVHPDDVTMVLRRLQRLIANEADTSEYRIVVKHGGVRWVRDRGLPIWDNTQKRVVEIYGAARDITDEREAQEKVRFRQEELGHLMRVATIGELSAGLAHEINQPLAAIVSYAKGCARRLRAGSATHEDLLRVVEEIASQAVRADEVLRRLGEFARRRPSQRATTDIGALIRTAVDLLAHETRHRHVTIEVDVPADLPAVDVDAIQIEQVLLNLVRNSFEAMNPIDTQAGQLRIRVAQTSPSIVQVTVADSGHGFGSIPVEQAFEPFFTTRAHALGIGLSISRSIVEAHGGRLWADQHVERGATVHFELPVFHATNRPT